MNKEDLKGISLFIRLAFIVYQIVSSAHEKKMDFHTQMIILGSLNSIKLLYTRVK